MRARVAFAVVLTACSFTAPATTQDASPDVLSPDSVDATMPLRVQDGLVAFWTFDDQPGTMFAAETSGAAGGPVPLEVISSGGIVAPTFAGGVLTAAMPGRLISALGTRLANDCASAGGATLEAWVLPGEEVQGTTTEPKFIVGLAANIGERNIALLQAADKWVGKVRTNAALNGTPDLVSTSNSSSTGMTHLVLVADSTQRILYVNNAPEAMDSPGAPQNWNLSYGMALLDEYQHARQWIGSIALVALYKRALTPEEVHKNWVLGPTAP